MAVIPSKLICLLKSDYGLGNWFPLAEVGVLTSCTVNGIMCRHWIPLAEQCDLSNIQHRSSMLMPVVTKVHSVL